MKAVYAAAALLLLAGCQVDVDKNSADRLENAADSLGATVENAADAAGNAAESAAATVENTADKVGDKVGDARVDVDVDGNKADSNRQ
ncbi:MAG: hypothetical protein ACJ8ER_04145 [Allosphingosinicella sp.]